jgi:hypothetical protein
MESARHKTLKKYSAEDEPTASGQQDTFRSLLEDSTKEAYSRPWHRLERGLRLNRLRIFIEDIALQFSLTKDDKDYIFLFLQKALDKKLLNTLKVVVYDTNIQKITKINGLEIKRATDGQVKIAFVVKKVKPVGTRKKTKDEFPSISANSPQVKIEDDIAE